VFLGADEGEEPPVADAESFVGVACGNGHRAEWMEENESPSAEYEVPIV
jgi:hypothetical protein